MRLAPVLIVLFSIALFPALGGAIGKSDHPAAPGEILKADLYGDPLPKGALLRLGTIRYRQELPIAAFAFAPDGKTYATAANTNAGLGSSIRLWESTTGKELLRFGGIPTDVRSIAFAPDGKTLVGGCGRDVVFWDTVSGKKLRQFEVQPNEVSCLAWSPDGKIIAVAGGLQSANFRPTVCLLEAETGKLLRALNQHSTRINGVAFSRDGNRLASTSADFVVNTNEGREVTPGCICIWDVATGQKLHQLDRTASHLEGNGDFRRSVAISPTLARAAFRTTEGNKSELEVWDIAGAKKLWSVEVRDQSFRFSADGKFVVVGAERDAIQLLDSETGKPIRTLAGHDGFGRHIAGIDPTEKYLATGRGGMFSPYDGLVRIWDMATGKELTGAEAHVDTVTLARITPDGKWVVTAADDGTIRLWDASTGKPMRMLTGYSNVNNHALAVNGSMLAANDKTGSLHLLGIPDFNPRPLLGQNQTKPICFAMSANGKTLAISDWKINTQFADNMPHFVDVQSGKMPPNLGDPQSLPMVFSEDGRILARAGGTIELWQPETAKKLMDIHAPIVEIDPNISEVDRGWTHISDVAFSADGRWLARSGTYHRGKGRVNKLAVWEVATGQLVADVANERHGATAIAFSPDGQILVTCPDTRYNQSEDRAAAKFWDLVHGELVGSLQGHQGSVTTVAFSPDGKNLLTGSTDGTVLIWDAAALPRAKAPVARTLSPAELTALWEELAGMDGRKAYSAVAGMTAGGKDTIDFLHSKLHPVKLLPPDELNRLVAALEDEKYATRVKAVAVLETQDERAANIARKMLKTDITLEMRQRLTLLLAKLEAFTPPPSELRKLRALAVLERIGNAEARKLLETLASGAEDARFTREARAALARLALR